MSSLSSTVGRFFVYAKNKLRFAGTKNNGSAEAAEPLSSLKSEEYTAHDTEVGRIFVSRPTETLYFDEEEFQPAIMSVRNTSLRDANAASGDSVRFEEPTDEFLNAHPRSARAEIDYSVFTIRQPRQTSVAPAADLFVSPVAVSVEPSAPTVSSAEAGVPEVPETVISADVPAVMAEPDPAVPEVAAEVVEVPAEVPVVMEAAVEEPVLESVPEVAIEVIEEPALEMHAAEPVIEEPVVAAAPEVAAEPALETPAAEPVVAEVAAEEPVVEAAPEVAIEAPVVEAVAEPVLEAADEEVVEEETTLAEELQEGISGYMGGSPIVQTGNFVTTGESVTKITPVPYIAGEENAMFYVGVGPALKEDSVELDSTSEVFDLPARDEFLEEECFKKVVEEEIAIQGAPAELPSVELPAVAEPVVEAPVAAEPVVEVVPEIAEPVIEAPAVAEPVVEVVPEIPAEPVVEVAPVEPVIEAPVEVPAIAEPVIEAPAEPAPAPVVEAPVAQKPKRVLARKSVRPEDVAAILFN